MAKTNDAAMNRYAKAREKKALAAQAVPGNMPMHDARYDLETLTRAQEIMRDKTRRKGAKSHARQQIKHLHNIIGGGKKPAVKDTSAEMERYVKVRGKKIAKRADGGSVERDTPYVVGEKGPEVFVPKKDGKVVPGGALRGKVVNEEGDKSMRRRKLDETEKKLGI